jgi:NAD(P)-dependent dehydrogenase (short-subunit alcohol dehydrogenase family)
LRFEGSVALVTGGVSGLGFGAASRVVAGGGSVVMLDLNQERGGAAVGQLGDRARFFECDVCDAAAVADSVGRAA